MVGNPPANHIHRFSGDSGHRIRPGGHEGYRRCEVGGQPARGTRSLVGCPDGKAAPSPRQLGVRGRELPGLDRFFRQCFPYEFVVHDHRSGPGCTLPQMDLFRGEQCVLDSVSMPVVQFHLVLQSRGDWPAHGANYGKVSSEGHLMFQIIAVTLTLSCKTRKKEDRLP